MSTPAEGSRADAFPPGVQRLVETGRLRVQPVHREQVAAVWRKAVESAGDAELPGMSVDGSLRSAYDAGHIAALALLAAHGLRTGSGQGHHEVAFAAAAAFGHGRCRSGRRRSPPAALAEVLHDHPRAALRGAAVADHRLQLRAVQLAALLVVAQLRLRSAASRPPRAAPRGRRGARAPSRAA
jgi:hypothetical protein